MKKVKTLSSPSLPIEIIHQCILLKLPIKSLLRLKVVCTQWNDLINEPNFVRKHLDRTKQQINSQKLMIYSYPLHEYYSLDYQTITFISRYGTEAVKLQYPIHDYRHPLPSITTIAGSVNGLICISSINLDKSSTTLVWNPTTSVHKVLPPHPDVPVTIMHGIGFAYNSTTHDYNVVRVKRESRIDIYSLKTNSWKLVMDGKGVPAHSPIFQKRFRVCSIDGIIYWLACHTPLDSRILNDQFIACFDLKEVDDDEKKNKKLIREIPMPPDFEIVNGFTDLKVMGGCVSVFKVGMYLKSLEIWSMMKINYGNKNDKVEYKWINRVMITDTSPLMNVNYRCVLPVCLSMDGKIVLRIPNNTPTELVLYNTGTKLVRKHPIHWISEMGICTGDKVPIEESQMYIETLVSPNFI